MHITSVIKKSAAVISVITVLLSLTGCQSEYKEKTSFAMGSVYTSKVFTDDTEKADEMLSLIDDAISEADMTFSATNENSELYTLNKFKMIYASSYLKQSLMKTIMVCNTLGRTVDISIGNITSLWGFHTESPSLPADEDISKYNMDNRIEKIAIDTESDKILLESGISLDMGAVGKGLACDAAAEAISIYNIPCIVSFGGTVMAYRRGPSDDKWSVGIRNPFGSDSDIFATLRLSPMEPKGAVFVSTSGSYEKNFTENGKTYHHILNSKTGYPVETDLISVTVVAPSGLNADALSTALFSNGLNDRSLEWLKNFGAEAVFVFTDKTYYITENLKDAFELTSSEFTFKEYNEN